MPQSKHRRTAYIAKACLQCAKSKQRCDGQLPCGRCTSKSLECSYPASKSRRASRNAQSSVTNQDQAVENPSTCQNLDNQSELSTQQLDNSSETRIATFPCWPPSDMGSVIGLSSQPSQAPDQNLGSVLDELGDFQAFGFSHIGAFWGSDIYPALEDQSPGLSWPLAPQFSLPQAMIHDLAGAAPAQDMLTPASCEPAVESLEKEAPAPSFTQTFRSPHSSSEESNITADASARNQSINQESDAWRAEDYRHVPRLTEDVYQEMTKHFERYNRDDEYWSPFTSNSFPPITHINIFIQVYFEEFHSLLPFLHQATFAPTKDTWMLSLGVAAVGCVFSRATNSGTTVYNLHEFLRRAIHVQVRPSIISDLCNPGVDLASRLNASEILFQIFPSSRQFFSINLA
ncbi:hypothetical protein FBULB1_13950 [Fusarium bulbicola]|nr:hypothetical protein FBULB1_13950 [Fusarium bulbicola]